MIIRGGFTSLTLAVYGEIVLQTSQTDALYEPKQISHIEYKPISMTLDPSKSDDPTALAKSLLTLIPNCPDLLLMVRLMFCLKPSNEDWEEPDFPHIYADLEQEYFDLSLEKAEKILSRPVSDAQSVDVIKEFALKIVDCISYVSYYLPISVMQLTSSERMTTTLTCLRKYYPTVRHSIRASPRL